MADPPIEDTSRPSRLLRVRLSFLLPIVLFLGLAIALGWGLTRDPKILPSTLINKPVPEFELPPVKGRTQGLANGNLKGEVSLVNVFASWCIPCRAEHPMLLRLNNQEIVTIHGLNYKDQPDDASVWLNELGDPYTRTGADIDGRVGIEWGVYGVPETFIINRDGKIAYKHIGAITPEILQEVILPLVERLKK